MASRIVLSFLLGIFIFSGQFFALHVNSDANEAADMENEELIGLFEVMDSLLGESSWAQEHPQPCTDTPWPGVECESEIAKDPPIFHVTKLRVAPDNVSPPCKPSASLSESLLKLPYLTTLSVFNCFITSPVTLSSTLFGSLFTSLEYLVLEANPALSGEIPTSLAEVTSLRVLSLSQNNLRGEIPRKFGGLINLEQLDLSYNNLTGRIPEEIRGMKILTILDLSWNYLEGNIPSSLGQLDLLQKIDLCYNRLDGHVPANLGKLKRLVLLDLSHNLLVGPIPENLSGLKELEYFSLDQNPLSTMIPMFLVTLKKLKSLSFSSCKFNGSIPNSLSSLKNLSALSLDNNSLTGKVPPEIGTLPCLDQLNLSYNQLSGELQFPEKFIRKLGKRLDIRGNHGLCTSSQLFKNNINSNLQVPICLYSSQGSNYSALSEEHHIGINGIQPSRFLGSVTLQIVCYLIFLT